MPVFFKVSVGARIIMRVRAIMDPFDFHFILSFQPPRTSSSNKGELSLCLSADNRGALLLLF